MASRLLIARWFAIVAFLALSFLSFALAQDVSSAGAAASSSSSATTPTSTSAAPAATATGNATMSACPPPFIVNAINSTSKSCTAACCMPCPAAQVFYKQGALEQSFTVVASVRAVSGVAIAIVLISYLVLPGRRSHPHLLILLFSVCMFPNQILGTMWLHQGESLLCKTPYEPATMMNSPICAAQGLGIMFTILTMALLATVLICNLHLLTVHRNSFIQRNLGRFETVCFILPLGSVIPTGLMHKVESTGFGSVCFASSDIAPNVIFYPLIAIIGFSSVIHLFTIFFMVKTVLNSGSTNASASRSINDNGELSKLSPSQLRRVRAREVVSMLKQQWRPALFVSLFLIDDLIYWTVYTVEISKLKNINPATTPGYQDWLKCLKTQQALGTDPSISQSMCAIIAAPFVPRPWVTTISDVAPAIFGTCVFFIFMTKREIWADWADLLTCNGGRRRASKNLFELKAESPTPPAGGSYHGDGGHRHYGGQQYHGEDGHGNNNHNNGANLKHSDSLRYGSEEALSKPDTYSQAPSYFSAVSGDQSSKSSAVLGGGIRKGANQSQGGTARPESRQQYYNGAEDDDYYLGRSSGGFVASNQVAMTRLGNQTTSPRQNPIQNSNGGFYNVNDLDPLDLNLASPTNSAYRDQKNYNTNKPKNNNNNNNNNNSNSVGKNYGKNITQILNDGSDEDLYSTIQSSTGGSVSNSTSTKNVGWSTNSVTSGGPLPLYSPPHSSAISTSGGSTRYTASDAAEDSLHARSASPPPHLPSKNRNRRN